MMPDFHVFYCRQRTGDTIDSYHPKSMPLQRIVKLAQDVLENTGDFLGLVDNDQGLLQFMYLAREDGDTQPIRVEIPDMARHGTYTKQLSPSELSDVLLRLPKRLSKDTVPGLHFESCRGL